MTASFAVNIDELVFDLYGLDDDERRLVLATREFTQNDAGEEPDIGLAEGGSA